MWWRPKAFILHPPAREQGTFLRTTYRTEPSCGYLSIGAIMASWYRTYPKDEGKISQVIPQSRRLGTSSGGGVCRASFRRKVLLHHNSPDRWEEATVRCEIQKHELFFFFFFFSSSFFAQEILHAANSLFQHDHSADILEMVRLRNMATLNRTRPVDGAMGRAVFKTAHGKPSLQCLN
ncbi:hypothetical protein SODALDRAFT_45319 [Sodiomyces alkalinus F11]|uniref:Uncharacterized protein n=1 Tax=Sodiomyces alkalinus (strain CBS 110278 / VKM F-3762 / F11) TaxID=1314773 RepID=A0A3N2QAD5_SODAK|nr:hypothetical protein SODALDRAFT_45319 [Sodiomyces alkalinus F11]ROT43714.1 hypothetical protein SODALDRAFT_45319 [Sodiomyces alkalinus F11]